MTKIKSFFKGLNNISQNARFLLLYGIISATIMLLFGIYFSLKCYNTFDYDLAVNSIICGQKSAQTFLLGTACAFVMDIAYKKKS